MNKKIILWVEDEPRLQTTRIKKLKKEVENVEILFAKNPVEAMDTLDATENKVVGIILDVMLPQEAGETSKAVTSIGVELAKKICEKLPHMKIVVLTNVSDTYKGKKALTELEKIACVREIINKMEPISKFVSSVIESFDLRKIHGN